MNKLLTLFTLLFYSSLCLPNKTYQIDMIVFAQPQAANYPALFSPKAPLKSEAITLLPSSKNTITPYRLLPNKSSRLNDAYYQLHRKPQYQILAHYIWRQPLKSQDRVALPAMHAQGWEVTGNIRVRQGSYYEWDSTFSCSPPSNPEQVFKMEQHHRLKAGLTYYFDNPQIGMLVRIDNQERLKAKPL